MPRQRFLRALVQSLLVLSFVGIPSSVGAVNADLCTRPDCTASAAACPGGASDCRPVTAGTPLGSTCPSKVGSSLCLSDADMATCTSGAATCQANISGAVSPPSASSNANTASTPAPFVPVVPQLEVPIPGLSFTPASMNGDVVTVPYLAQYLAAAYRYLIAVSAIAATVMFIYGGFRYLIGTVPGSIQRGKEIMTDAVAGMILVLAAYVILNTINPETLNLQPLTVGGVSRVEDEAAESGAVDSASCQGPNANDAARANPPPFTPVQPSQLPQPITWSYCDSYQQIGVPPYCRARFKATLRPVRISGGYAWCSDCPGGVVCAQPAHEDATCRAIGGSNGEGVPCGGGFGLYLRTSMGNCRAKQTDKMDGLAGITFGMEDYIIWNVPEILRAFDRRDHAAFIRTMTPGDLSQWYQNGTINRDWFCQQQITQRGLYCNANFRQAFQNALHDPAMAATQLKQAYDFWVQRNQSGTAQFSSLYGRVMWATMLNNPGSCGQGLGPLVQACSGRTESDKIDCFFQQFLERHCRGTVGSSQNRIYDIQHGLSGIDRSTPAPAVESFDAIVARCLRPTSPTH